MSQSELGETAGATPVLMRYPGGKMNLDA